LEVDVEFEFYSNSTFFNWPLLTTNLPED